MEESTILANLGSKIRQLRMQKNMTQNDLANRCDFEKAGMSRIESGKTNLTLRTLHKISVVLETPLYEFFQN